ncbi:MAG: hypothetical protein JXL84_04925, partial [Deltaproteobacteria bacterium]|nr:hypothetical protein [Deltaproteobacteria bacterium]
KGFKYIHHLVKNRFKIFSPSELLDLYGTPGNEQRQLPASKEDLLESSSSRDPLMDKPYIRELRKRLSDLREEMIEAEKMNDIGRKDAANAEFEVLLSQLRREVDRDGESREFSNDPSTRAKKSVAKNIDRSLKAMQKRDEELYRHFHQSLKPVESSIMAYRPTIDINWRTE